MNIPFKFSYAAQNDYGLLWNPHALATNGTDKVNSILANLADPARFGLIEPTGDAELEAIVCVGDPTTPAAVTFGLFDTATNTFHAIYPLPASGVAGGGVADIAITDGFHCPLGTTVIPCLRNDTNAAGIVSGHVRIRVVPPATSRDAFLPLFNDDGTVITDGNNHPLFQ